MNLFGDPSLVIGGLADFHLRAPPMNVYGYANPTGSLISYLELVHCDLNDVNVATIRIAGIDGVQTDIPAGSDSAEIGDFDSDGIPDMRLMFDRASVLAALNYKYNDLQADVKITLTGKTYNGESFELSTWLKVINKSPLELKNDVLNELGSLETGNNRVDEKIDKTIECIKNSMKADLWLDEIHLDPKHGFKVFDYEKSAVVFLHVLVNDRDTPEVVKEVFMEAVDQLVLAGGILSYVPYEDAQVIPNQVKSSKSSTDKNLEMCLNEFQAADLAYDSGSYFKIFDHYKNAWRYGQKAI